MNDNLKNQTYEENNNAPTDLFGKCTVCGSGKSKLHAVIDNVAGVRVYFDLICPNDHIWRKPAGKPKDDNE